MHEGGEWRGQCVRRRVSGSEWRESVCARVRGSEWRESVCAREGEWE